jgi:CheY-like chemotaxis protein
VSNHKTLIVDPSKLVAKQYLNVLKSLGIQCNVVRDGYEALGLLLDKNFDSLLVSSHVPKINGVALIAILQIIDWKKIEKFFSVLVFNDVDSEEDCSNEGTADFCIKNDQKLLENLEIVFLKILSSH